MNSIEITDGWGTVTGDGTARTICEVLALDDGIEKEAADGCIDAPMYLPTGSTRAHPCFGQVYSVPSMVRRD